MRKNRILPSLVCGFGAAVLITLPGFKSIGCCLVIPAAAAFSLFLSKKSEKDETEVRGQQAFLTGLLAGVFAALFSTLFEIIMTLITHNNEFVETFPQSESLIRGLNLGPLIEDSIQLMRNMVRDIKFTGFSIIYLLTVLFSNLVIDSLMGIAGGFIGMALFNRKKRK